ncbi:unnamed protein product [Urochloa humidicola]
MDRAREDRRLLDLAADRGFDRDRDLAASCLARLLEVYGEDDMGLVTVESCGDDFLASLALNDMMMKNVPNGGVAMESCSTFIEAESFGRHAHADSEAFDFPSDDSYFDMGRGLTFTTVLPVCKGRRNPETLECRAQAWQSLL